MCLSVVKLAPAIYATNSVPIRYTRKIIVVVHPDDVEFVSKHAVVLQRTAKKCTNNYNARAKPLFCSLNILFCDVLVAVAIVFW